VYTIPGDGKGIDFEFEVCEPFGKDSFKLIGLMKPIKIEKFFSGCQDKDNAFHFFSLDNTKCGSWEFLKKLKSMLSKFSIWSETSLEVESIRKKGVRQ
jgi:hypothetical protein